MSAAAEIESRAAAWLMRREEPGWSTADQSALDAWLADSFAHKAAYWRLEHGWRSADRLAAIRPARSVAPPVTERASRRGWQKMAIAASVAALVGTALALFLVGVPGAHAPMEVARADFSTRIGDRKILSLPDGTRVELNTATIVRTALGDDRRDVWLDQGEAYFDVAHVAERPFVVHAGDRRVTVLGTKFSVRREGRRVEVAVVEGRVRIDPVGQERPERSATLAAGDVAIAAGESTLVTSRSMERVAADLSWRRGMLAFEGSTLADAVGEFNRYNRRQVVVTDPDVAAMRIGGSFRADNVDAFLRLLHDAYGVRVEEKDQEVTISG